MIRSTGQPAARGPTHGVGSDGSLPAVGWGSRVLVLATTLAAFPGAALGQPELAGDREPPTDREPPGSTDSSADQGLGAAAANDESELSVGDSSGAPGMASTSTAPKSETPTVANAPAARSRDKSPDFDLSFRSRTYLQVYQRALLPGPGGATVDTDLLAPAHEYVYLRADRVDTPWANDSVGFELSAWTSAELAGNELGSNPDGDVTIANVYHDIGPATLRLGRQVQTAGAARFVRFDGLSADLGTTSGIRATAYGGFTVLPRWNARPSYHHLGSAFDTLVESPEAFPEPHRSGDWLVGGRVGYTHDWLTAGVGVHEQRTDSELDRRNAAVDLRLSPLDELDLTGRVIADLDAVAVADASAAADVYPVEPLHLALEYRRVTPSLLLSKQSVFSVFSTERFDEAGGEVGYEATDRFEVGAGQWVELLGFGDVATRTQLRARIYPQASQRVVLQFVYGRVSEPDNGYHSARISARWQVAVPVSIVAEHYAYFYDEKINGYALSSVEALNAQYAGSLPLRFLLGGTLAHTPYAAHDAQVLLRVDYEFERMEGGT